MSGDTTAVASPRPRFDFYQTETVVNLSVFVKNLRTEDVDVTFGDHSLSMSMRPCGGQGPPQSLELQLYDNINKENSSFTVLTSKVDVTLQKRNAGRRWASLEASEIAQLPTYQDANSTSSHAASSSLAQSAALTLAPPTSSSMPATSRLRSKWDSLKLEDDDDDASGGKRSGVSSGGGIDAFFQKLYADADDDTRRAMMKSYTESGGTSLSTNWAEVGKGEVETRPPEGMEAKKWN